MLKKQYRLKKRKSFNYIHRRGKRIGNEVLGLVFVYAKMRTIKIGFSVSKKVGNSVVRHRATRLLRAAANTFVDKIKPDHSLIFIANEGITKRHLNEIIASMENVLKRGGLLK